MALREQFTYFFKRFGCTRRIKESIPREKNSRFQTGEGMRLGKRRRKSRKAKNKGREKTRLMKVTNQVFVRYFPTVHIRKRCNKCNVTSVFPSTLIGWRVPLINRIAAMKPIVRKGEASFDSLLILELPFEEKKEGGINQFRAYIRSIIFLQRMQAAFGSNQTNALLF